MKILKKLLKNRKGISMTEVVVAMAVVVLITGAAVSVLIASVKADAKYITKSVALEGCETAVECIRFADGFDEGEALERLKTALTAAGFEAAEDENTFTLSVGDETVKVVVGTADGGTEVENYVVYFNDEEIYEKSKN